MRAKKNNNGSFEYSYKKLEDILNRLESEAESISLDEMLILYKEGLILLKDCREKLSKTEIEIKKINTELKSNNNL